ncbi:hypothetical protein MAR_010850 [Mya arenaria]|uniref:Uncharacterized protein n=1 Tax=Mya arenaria TaxID=6604 RepID=A0ABY7FWN6_MYAAR|nr:hypothetical protein MAR_010850 [Mya arenaria]
MRQEKLWTAPIVRISRMVKAKVCSGWNITGKIQGYAHKGKMHIQVEERVFSSIADSSGCLGSALVADDQLLDDETNDDAGDGDPVDTNDNFDPETGLWKYKCESSHPAAARESDMLRRNIIKRDGWNDLTLSRQADGSLKGPNFYPDMPDNTCCCGSGWLKRDDDPDYSENGKLIPLGRVLTVYTQFAPVQCDVYKRVCYNPIDDSRCELAWNEGQSESIHTQQTLHRRMDRCYLKNKPGVEKRQMIAYREALDNIARTTVAEFEPLSEQTPTLASSFAVEKGQQVPPEVPPEIHHVFNV